MQFYDTVALDGVRKTRDGYLVATAKTARTGIQIYTGREVDPENQHGLRDRAQVRVYRSPEEVFNTDAMASQAHRPITIDHPPEMVDAKNWKKLSGGMTGGQVARDGEFVEVPLTLMDQATIDAWEGGKRELSWGYSCELDFTDGVTPAGEKFDAQQKNIRANHLAICSAARGGPDLRIGDQEHHDEGGRHVATKIITFDGLPVEVTDAAEAVINKLKGLLDTSAQALDAANADVVKLKAEAVAKDAEVARLTDELGKAKVTPQQMRDAAKAYAKTVALAKQLGATVTDEMDEAAIKRAVVVAKMGDSTKGYTDEHVGIAFDTLTVGLKVDDAQIDPLRNVIADGPVNVGDAEAAFRAAERKAADIRRNAWKGTPEKAA
jgi:hypothetical protein